jgi:hypothetical protein
VQSIQADVAETIQPYVDVACDDVAVFLLADVVEL